jgi:UDP-N-acetylmuramoyl-L-alanyl-D-glutamate--2,6-diaminopimelate ligase
MEVKCHEIHQKNRSFTFAGGVFTNLSHDHFGLPSNLVEYRDVKKYFSITYQPARVNKC